MLYFGTHRDQMIEDVHGMSFSRRPKKGRKDKANRRAEIFRQKRGSNLFILSNVH